MTRDFSDQFCSNIVAIAQVFSYVHTFVVIVEILLKSGVRIVKIADRCDPSSFDMFQLLFWTKYCFVIFEMGFNNPCATTKFVYIMLFSMIFLK